MRASLEWEWQPSTCDIRPLDPRRLSLLLQGRRVLFAGDSLTEQLFVEMRCVLGKSVHSDSEEHGAVTPVVPRSNMGSDATRAAQEKAAKDARAYEEAPFDSLSRIRWLMAQVYEESNWKKLEYFETGIKEFRLDGEGARGRPGRVGLFRANNLLRTVFEFDRAMETKGVQRLHREQLLDRAWRILLRGTSPAAGSPHGAPWPPMRPGDVLILNAGAHFATFGDDAFSQRAVAFWRQTARAVRRYAPPGALVVFRTLYTGQRDCDQNSSPFDGLPEAWRSDVLPEMPYNWAHFAKWNHAIVDEFEREFNSRASPSSAGNGKTPKDTAPARFAILNVTAFSYRADGRKLWIWHDIEEGGSAKNPVPRCCDCLHFSTPGPLHEMLRLLAHLLEDTLLGTGTDMRMHDNDK